jgi:hypothetical protein
VQDNAALAVRIASIKFELADSVAVQRITDYNNITSSALGLDGSLPIQAPFPPVAITGTSKVHSGVTYELASSFNPATTYLAFNKTNANSYQSAITYDPATGLYTGAESTLVDGVAVPGEWITVKTDSIKTLGEVVISPTHLSTLVTSRSPRAFTVAAYVNNAWVSVLQRTGIVDWTTESKIIAFDANASSSEYRLIVSEVGNLTSGATEQDRIAVSPMEIFEAPAFVVTKLNVLEQRIADLIYKLYGVTNLEDAPP